MTLSFADAAPLRRAPGVDDRPASDAIPPPPQPAPTRPTSPGRATPGAGIGAPYSGPRTMIVIGDSLAVGMAPVAPGRLPGWDVPVDGRIGRPLAEGMRSSTRRSCPRGARQPRDPRLQPVHQRLSAQRSSRSSPPSASRWPAWRAHGCAIWATIARPPLRRGQLQGGQRPPARAGERPALAGRLLLVPVEGANTTAHPAWLARHDVHATPEGYARAARGMYADGRRELPGLSARQVFCV